MKSAIRELSELFLVFFKIGAFTFGGGYAMLPILQREIIEKRGWATMEEISEYFAIGQVTPGIIAVNTATFIGFKLKGILGGIIATLGVVAPSLFIISIIAAGLRHVYHYPIVRHAFAGIRVAVGALILDAVIKLGKGAVKDLASVLVCAAAFAATVVFKSSPIPVVAAAALAGFLLYRPGKRADR